jgi:hypothetical protein
MPNVIGEICVWRGVERGRLHSAAVTMVDEIVVARLRSVALRRSKGRRTADLADLPMTALRSGRSVEIAASGAGTLEGRPQSLSGQAVRKTTAARGAAG